MAAPDTPEIIDLTNSPEPTTIILVDEDEAATPRSEPAPERENRRTRRRRRAEEHAASNEATKSLIVSREPSTHGERTQLRDANSDGREAGRNEAATQDGEERLPRKKRRRASKKDEASSTRILERDPEPEAGEEPLYFVDITPAQLPPGIASQGGDMAGPSSKSTISGAEPSSSEPVTLLLPSHVAVLDAGDGTPVEIIRPPDSDSDSESYIEYLDYDDRTAGISRYFDNRSEEAKQAKFVCKNCKAENAHKTFECPVLICLTCGARDEHSTRSCPISKTCFNCGMKGHINKTCPNRYSSRAGGIGSFDDCDRCGSGKHSTNECPTLWRLYEYVADAERECLLRLREEKRSLGLGQGGEGYIARDQWCYNCGGEGHLGDDCTMIAHVHDIPAEASAFSAYNTMTGPFFDATAEPSQSKAKPRQPRDWETGNSLPDGWGFDAPVNVGKRGRTKDRARMEQRAQELQDEEDADDWFGSARNVRNRGVPSTNGDGARKDPSRTIKVSTTWNGKSNRESGNAKDRSRSQGGVDGRSRQPSLLARLTDDGEVQIRGAAGKKPDSRRRDDHDDRGRDGDKRRDRDRDYDRRRDSERSKHNDRYDRPSYGRRDSQDSRGPRYKGGYSR